MTNDEIIRLFIHAIEASRGGNVGEFIPETCDGCGYLVDDCICVKNDESQVGS